MTRSDNEQNFAVLFVDDEEKAQKYFRMAYANDFPVLTAGSVPEAVEILEQKADEIAVLITDQRMPGQQGVDLLRRARGDWPEIVRILTTAYSDLDDAISAVNRGEILRYVTKPWDIQALRVDLRHAMDFFLLRRERDLLVAEKFSVRRSMLHGDRLRCLLAIAAGLQRFRHAPQAVAAWSRDSLRSASKAQPAATELELWGLEASETLDLMGVHCRLRVLHDAVESGFPDRTDLVELLHTAGLAVNGHAGNIAVRRDLMVRMISNLAQLAGDSASARIERVPNGSGNMALTLHVTGSGPTDSPFACDLATGGPSSELLGSYLIAWHHGGVLEAVPVEEQWRFVLTLPEKPDAVTLPNPDEDWLAEQFAMLEDWQ